MGPAAGTPLPALFWHMESQVPRAVESAVASHGKAAFPPGRAREGWAQSTLSGQCALPEKLPWESLTVTCPVPRHAGLNHRLGLLGRRDRFQGAAQPGAGPFPGHCRHVPGIGGAGKDEEKERRKNCLFRNQQTCFCSLSVRSVITDQERQDRVKMQMPRGTGPLPDRHSLSSHSARRGLR